MHDSAQGPTQAGGQDMTSRCRSGQSLGGRCQDGFHDQTIIQFKMKFGAVENADSAYLVDMDRIVNIRV
ncbi:hypothetical protein [Piscinibacterium candidicorallinum]|uniref:Uncharacterized protein n=1 Tax=Piscinibacterium candidicorallinum TaxID=1793872 RepID=A0ABV7H3I5_9BURK